MVGPRFETRNLPGFETRTGIRFHLFFEIDSDRFWVGLTDWFRRLAGGERSGRAKLPPPSSWPGERNPVRRLAVIVAWPSSSSSHSKPSKPSSSNCLVVFVIVNALEAFVVNTTRERRWERGSREREGVVSVRIFSDRTQPELPPKLVKIDRIGSGQFYCPSLMGLLEFNSKHLYIYKDEKGIWFFLIVLFFTFLAPDLNYIHWLSPEENSTEWMSVFEYLSYSRPISQQSRVRHAEEVGQHLSWDEFVGWALRWATLVNCHVYKHIESRPVGKAVQTAAFGCSGWRPKK